MNQPSFFADFAKGAPMTAHFALMTDLSRVVPAPAEHPSSQVAGILFSFDRDIRDVSDTSIFGSLLQGSSPTPLAVVAVTYGRHAFYLVANPLDATLRPMLEQQRKAKRLVNMLVLPNEKFVRAAPEVVAWDVACWRRPKTEPLMRVRFESAPTGLLVSKPCFRVAKDQTLVRFDVIGSAGRSAVGGQPARDVVGLSIDVDYVQGSE